MFKNLTKPEIAIKIAAAATGFCASVTTSRVIKNNVVAENKLQSMEHYVGAAVIGAMVSDQAERWMLNLAKNVIVASPKTEDPIHRFQR